MPKLTHVQASHIHNDSDALVRLNKTILQWQKTCSCGAKLKKKGCMQLKKPMREEIRGLLNVYMFLLTFCPECNEYQIIT